MNNFLNYLGYHISSPLFSLLNVSENSSIEELLKSDGTITPAESPNYLFWFMRIFFAMIVVIVFMVVLLYILRKYLNKNNFSLFDKRKNIEVLSTAYLGPKKSICIVRIESEIIVLGVTPNSINFLTKLSSENESGKKGVKQPSEKSTPESQLSENTSKSKDKDFKEILESKIGDTDKVEIDESILGEEFDGEKTLLENIKKLKKVSQNPMK